MTVNRGHGEPEGYDVVWPSSSQLPGSGGGTRHIGPLDGKRVAFVWDDIFRGEEMFRAFTDEAHQRGIEFETVTHEHFGNIHGHDERNVVDTLPARLVDQRIDAAIVGVGACGSCTPAVIRACRAVDAAGIPTLALVSSGFIRQARSIARSLGIEHTWIAEYPGVIPNDTDEVFHSKIKDAVVPSLFEGFAAFEKGVTVAEAAAEQSWAPRDIVFRGTFDEVQDEFERQLWSDGLPVVPPTVERVEDFLRHTDRDPDEVLGTLLPANRQATIWSVAVNAVLAGCRPEYLPVLVALVEAMVEPRWRMEDAGCTPGWEPLVVVSGPIVDELGFNYGAGAMRMGRRSNTSVGRFARMYMRNVAGLLIPPGDTDKAAIGLSMNVAMAENDAATLAVGWEPVRVERGFELSDSVVTAQSCLDISGPVYTGGNAEHQLATIAEAMTRTLGPWSYTSLVYQEAYALILMSPSVAEVLSEAGYSKGDVNQYMYENVHLSAGLLEDCSIGGGGNKVVLAELVAKGITPSHYADSDDPERQVPLLLRPDMVSIVVGGDAARNQNRIYVNNHAHGVPISKRIEKVGEGGQPRLRSFIPQRFDVSAQ